MRRPIVILALMALAMTSLVSAADPPELINYQGVLRDSSDAPLDGSFPMTFRFFDAVMGGNEILVDSHGSVNVSGGLFNVELGSGSIADGSGPGIFTSLGVVFAQNTNLYLQVEVNGETLSPRTPVAATGYALNARRVRGVELVSSGPLDLWVDAINGDDANDGLSLATAKASIMSAVRAIPPILNGNVTVHIKPGTYTENVVLARRIRLGAFEVNLTGDGRTVVIIQAPVPGDSAGILCLDSPVNISGMEISGHGDGVIVIGGRLAASECKVTDNSSSGFKAAQGAFIEITDCDIQGNGTTEAGIEAEDNSTIELTGAITISSTDEPVFAIKNSSISFLSLASCSFGTSLRPMFAGLHSTIRGYDPASSTGCTNLPGCTAGTTGECDPEE